MPWGASLAVLLAAAGAGCTVGPDFKEPDALSTERYQPAAEEPAGAAAAVIPSAVLGTKVTADWWTLFRSRLQ